MPRRSFSPEEIPKVSQRSKIRSPATAGGIGGKSGFEIDATAFPFELGYMFVAPHARGKGLSNELVKEAIRLAGGRRIFATADRQCANACGAGQGWVRGAGEPYGGRP
jgi:GNAT superfamily N-acetyltransferase